MCKRVIFFTSGLLGLTVCFLRQGFRVAGSCSASKSGGDALLAATRGCCEYKTHLEQFKQFQGTERVLYHSAPHRWSPISSSTSSRRSEIRTFIVCQYLREVEAGRVRGMNSSSQ